MTTEIAVLNKLGVALATDSAVTITSGGRTKIFNSADKLFELSAHFPVAVMINGNMDCVGVPWEIVVKDFRHEQGRNPRPNVDGWLSDFLAYVEAYGGIDDLAANNYIEQNIIEEIYGIRAKISRKMQDYVFGSDRKKPIQGVEQGTMMDFFREVIADRFDEVSAIGVATSLEDLEPEAVLASYSDLFEAQSKRLFAPVNLDDDVYSGLVKLFTLIVVTPEISEFTTGIVVAGFGSESLFAEISAAEVDGKVMSRLKVSNREPQILSGDEEGRVVSFAQTDVIERLLGGADPQFIKKTADFINNAVHTAAVSIEEVCRPKRINKAEVTRRQAAIEAIVEALSDEYVSSTSINLRKKFTQEFDKMVAMMPKQELVELAEALVSITDVERKASSDEGTVGGPIDVALVTKHDGFVWIKRKHYFEKHLNPSYFWRKYGNGSLGGEHENPIQS